MRPLFVTIVGMFKWLLSEVLLQSPNLSIFGYLLVVPFSVH